MILLRTHNDAYIRISAAKLKANPILNSRPNNRIFDFKNQNK